MTERKTPLFREKALQEAAEPEQLLDYIRVTGPSLWLQLAAVAALLAGALLWGFTGWLTERTDYNGYAANGQVTVLAADVAGLNTGLAAEVDGEAAVILSIAEQPLSYQQLTERYDGYLLYQLAPAEWSFPLVLDAPQAEDGLVRVSIILRQTRPISLLLN